MNSKEALNKIPYRVIIMSAGFLLLLINIIRIFKVPFTHDEGLTYALYLKAGYREIFFCEPLLTNNHFLNSFLSKFFSGIFGYGIFWLRLPNLIAQLFYMVYSYKLVTRLTVGRWFGLAGFLLLNLNPFMFDFWGLCRGYGLAMAMLMVSVYYLLLYIKNHSRRHLWLAAFVAVFAVYSSLTLLYYLVAVYIVSVLSWYRRFSLQDLLPLLFNGLLLVILVAKPVIELQNTDGFLYGFYNGFIKDSVGSLVQESLYLREGDVLIPFISYTAVVFAILPAAWWMTRWPRGKSAETDAGIATMLLLFIPAALIRLQHFLLGSRFAVDRAVLFFYPLFIISVLFWLCSVKRFRLLAGITIISITALSAFNFLKNINLSSTRTWNYDKDNIAVINRMLRQYEGGDKIRARVYWLYQPGINYYLETKHSDKFHRVIYTHEPVAADSLYDFYYVSDDDTAAIRDAYVIDTVFSNGRGFYLKRAKN